MLTFIAICVAICAAYCLIKTWPLPVYLVAAGATVLTLYLLAQIVGAAGGYYVEYIQPGCAKGVAATGTTDTGQLAVRYFGDSLYTAIDDPELAVCIRRARNLMR